eukprot:CAMPEP_0172322346 /NCGR_PEP_ID=MMETSP1058-20130122/45653_1 /TAXON_ID=83371 /ORGANISM="Detonula confervacea, Strain CCMP 353" /LENGTH=213 /DNA_ID=CAMNT_0013038069 /DNA_START=42 /DNA_END=683 /DNA_ORIENTATION=+
MAPKECNHCGTTDTDGISICAGCRLVSYCSRDCQLASWPNHKFLCKAAKKEAKRHLDDVVSAARDGDLVELRRLLKTYPLTINMIQTIGFGIGGSALEGAASNGQVGSVKVLLDMGANQNQGDPQFGQLPLHRAAEAGHLETVKVLLERGGDILKPDGMGQTALHFAAEYGHTELARFMLENGAKPALDVLYYNKTPKDWALKGGHTACAALL